MTKDNSKDFLPLVQALAKGKTIQAFNGITWDDLPHEEEDQIMFDGSPCDYRLKPEPREWFVTVSKKSGEAFHFEQRGRNNDDLEIVKVREVIE